MLTFSYFIKPDKSMNGSFRMTGRLITVSNRSSLKTIFMREKLISIEGVNGLLPDQMKAGSEKTDELKTIKKPVSQTVGQKKEISFRVQVSVSSNRITEKEFNASLGLSRKIGVKIIQTFLIRSISLVASFRLRVSRLSYSFLPFDIAISAFANPRSFINTLITTMV